MVKLLSVYLVLLAFTVIKKGLRDLVSQGIGPDFLCSAVVSV